MLACPNCNRALPAALLNAQLLQPCPHCLRPVMAVVFPAFLAPTPIGTAGETLIIEGESSCYYHPEKKAVVGCEGCGRFLCALCDIDLNGQHLCPGCVETGRRKGKLKLLENQRIRYDSMALLLALAPLLIFYLTLFTAPATIYVVIRHWNSPGSIVGRSRWRMVVAFIIALAECAGWIIAIYAIMHVKRTVSTR